MRTFESPSGRRYESLAPAPIAEGSFGVLYKCTKHEGDATLPGYAAVKVVSWSPGGLDKVSVLSEKVTLEKIAPHDGVIRLEDSWVEEQGVQGVLYLVMDYYEHGDLLEYSKTHRIDDSTLCDLHLQFMRILEHVHSQGFIFLDVKPNNILLADVNPPRIILTDFGSARTPDQIGSSKMFYTDLYAAPEVRQRSSWSTIKESCDYYSWCISLFTLMVVQDWEKNKHVHPLNSFGDGDKLRSMNLALIPNDTARQQLFQGFLTVGMISTARERKKRMMDHPWVAKRPSADPAPEEPSLFGRKAAVSSSGVEVARVEARLFGFPSSAAAPSSSVTVRGPSLKRDSAEKCLEKEKVGKSSGVGSTAGKRASSARKKAVKARAATPGSELDGPAQAVLKLRTGRVRKCYKY
ncbi:unnamed protein product [Peniophora sp. CBMAI 1063]|nr:unnamed protein product [Peniophora sp. CBMAI 1063]